MTDAPAIQAAVASIIEDMVVDMGLALDAPIGPETRLIADIDFSSVDFIHLIVELEKHFQKKMGFHDLIMPNGQYIDDLAVGRLVAFIQSRLDGDAPTATPEAATPATPEAPAAPVEKLRPADLEAFRKLMPTLDQWGTLPDPTVPNPRAIFVLTSPRSGSTLLRTILAGNPRLFAPPELYLLNYATMAQRHRALDNPWNKHLLTGTVSALMHLRSCSAGEAEATMRHYEENAVPTCEFYRDLQQLVGDRLLVDKTPIYPMHPEILRRAERDFAEPLFVHLVRHPCGMIRSFADAKMDQLVPFMRDSGLPRRHLAELTWLVTNQNIADFFETLPEDRRMRLRFEDVVHESEPTLRRLCDFLRVPFAEAMLDPYQDPNTRMTGGTNRAADFSGDLKIHLHRRIEPDVAERWRKFESEDSLSEMSRRLAASFGYELR